MEEQSSLTVRESGPIAIPWVTDPPVGCDREERIRRALRLARGPLPRVGRRWLRHYYEHLVSLLPFPFQARYFGETDFPEQLASGVTVVALLDPNEGSGSEDTGLLCKARQQGEEVELPLVDIEVDEDHPSFQDLDDYWYWFWNWRFDPRI